MPEDDELLDLPDLVRDREAEGRAKAAATRARKAASVAIAEDEPVAEVLVDVALAHLDRSFDYAVPASMAATAKPGVRVKVRFAGQDVDGYVIGRKDASEHEGKLTPLRRVVSDEQVLHPAVAALAADVAERYAGTRSDVLRLAVPARHATVEQVSSTRPPRHPLWDAAAATRAWDGHEPGAALLQHLAGGGSPRAVWHAAPGADWPAMIAHAVAATLASGRGAVVCVPDGKDVARLDAALTAVLGDGHHATLTAEEGPARRYHQFLSVSRGAVRVAIGTRSAAFAPVRDLGLLVIWDDGDDLHAEPRAPYPHTREVLLLRAEREGAGLLVGGFTRTVEAAYLLATSWAHAVLPSRELTRARALVRVAGASDADLDRDPLTRSTRMPHEAHALVRDALGRGPVLVQTPRRGYAAALACETCRVPARCPDCSGPLRTSGPVTPPTCVWCGHERPGWTCPACGGHGLRAPVVGDHRTAEELGRSFPGTRVLSSSGDRVLAEVDGRPGIVVATPGAEPVATTGYAAVLLLDTWLTLSRPGLRTEEEALRRWSDAVGLLGEGGQALAVGDPALPVLQALVRWDQPGFAERETGTRREAHLPPASRLATITGPPGAVDDALTLLDVPEGAEVLGPVSFDEGRDDGEVRVVVRVPRARGAALSAALSELQRLRSARKLDPVRIQVDPVDL